MAEKLRVKVGDRLRMGEALLRIIGVIEEEPDRTGEGFTLGPVVLADLDGVAATQLVQPGSLYTMRYRVKTGTGVDLAAASERFTKAFPGGGWQAVDRSNGAPGTRRFIERLGEFLALVGLTALAVAGIGVGNGVTSWLEDKRGAIATFKTLGADGQTIFLTYLIQILIVAAAAVAVGLAVGALLPWIIVTLAGDLLPVAPRLALYPQPLGLAALYGVLIALLFSLAPLARARAVTPANLFRTNAEGSGRPGWRVMLGMLLTGGAIAALAIGTAHEPRFAAGFIACVTVCGFPKIRPPKRPEVGRSKFV